MSDSKIDSNRAPEPVGLYPHACDLNPYLCSCTYIFVHHEDMGLSIFSHNMRLAVYSHVWFVSFYFLSCTNRVVHRADMCYSLFPSRIVVHQEGWPYTRLCVVCLFSFYRAQVHREGMALPFFSLTNFRALWGLVVYSHVCGLLFFLFNCRAQIIYSASWGHGSSLFRSLNFVHHKGWSYTRMPCNYILYINYILYNINYIVYNIS